jgi:phage terminase small subunit
MRGRKPTPLKVREAEGDTQKVGARKLRERIAKEPKAERGLPTCPGYLMGEAREAWFFWTEQLESMQLACMPDAKTLEAACIAYEMMRKSYAASDFGPLMKALTQLNKWTSEFGLTPVSRTRLAVNAAENSGSELLEALNAPREPRKVAVQ